MRCTAAWTIAATRPSTGPTIRREGSPTAIPVQLPRRRLFLRQSIRTRRPPPVPTPRWAESPRAMTSGRCPYWTTVPACWRADRRGDRHSRITEGKLEFQSNWK